MKVCLMLGLLIPLAIEDMKTGRLNLIWMIIIGTFGAVYRFAVVKTSGIAFLSAMTVGASLLLLAANSNAIGSGDGVMYLAVGSICGFWECFSLLGQCMILCFLTGLIFRFILRRPKNTLLPVAPFALAAYLMNLLVPVFLGGTG